MSRLRRLRRGALALAGAALATLILCELGLRALGRFPATGFIALAPHSEFHDVQTNWDIVYRTNSLGLRDDEISREKPPGTLRIAVIGDSFAFGQGVERGELFPDVLEAALRRRGRPVEVMNVSNLGIGAEGYQILFEGLALPHHPDLVILNLYGNDAVRTHWVPGPLRALRRLSHHSRLVMALRQIKRDGLFRLGMRLASDPEAFWSELERAAASDEIRAELAAFRREHGSAVNSLVGGCVKRPGKMYRAVMTDPESFGWWQLRQALEHMIRRARQRGVALAIAVIPSGAQVDPAQLELRRRFGVELPPEVLEGPGRFQRLVCELAAAHDVPCHDPLERFRAAGPGLYQETDAHWTPAGHRLYAESLLAFAGAEGLL